MLDFWGLGTRVMLEVEAPGYQPKLVVHWGLGSFRVMPEVEAPGHQPKLVVHWGLDSSPC